MSETIFTSVVFECSQRPSSPTPEVSSALKPDLPTLAVVPNGDALVSPAVAAVNDGIWNCFAWQKQSTFASGGIFSLIGTP